MSKLDRWGNSPGGLISHLFEATQKMSELLLQIQKQSGKRTDLETSLPNGNEVRTKTEIVSDMGMSSKQVSQYQQMAQNPDAVQAAIQKAIDNGDVVSRNQVMKEIRSVKDELKRQLAEKDRRIFELAIISSSQLFGLDNLTNVNPSNFENSLKKYLFWELFFYGEFLYKIFTYSFCVSTRARAHACVDIPGVVVPFTFNTE